MKLPALDNFSLVGRTALSLRYGHRSSVDIDLFYHMRFNHPEIISELEQAFGDRFNYKQQHTQFGIFCFIDNVKVDLVQYPQRQISESIVENGLRIYSDGDIAAMKIQAILGRAKKKDLWDLHELLRHYPLQQIMDCTNRNVPFRCWPSAFLMPLPIFLKLMKATPPSALKDRHGHK